MALTTATISGSFVRPDAGVASMTAYIEAASVNSILTALGTIILSKVPIKVQSDGTASVTIWQLPQAGIAPSDARWRLVMEVGSAHYAKEFNLTGDTTWNALVDVSGVPITSSLVSQAQAAAAAAAASAASISGVTAVTWTGETSVKSPTYGAVGNDIADDTTAIHNARDAAGVGGTLVFPSGTYKTVAGLVANVANQQWILLPGAVIHFAPAIAGKAVDIAASGVTILGPGKVDGGAISGSSCIFIEPALSDVTIQGVELVNSQYGVRCKGANGQTVNTRIRVVGCHIHGCTGNGITFNGSTTDAEAVRNEIHDVGGTGIWAGGDGCDRLIVAENHITNVTGQGIGLNGVSGSGGPIGAPNAVISNNTIVGSGAIGISLNCSDGAKCIGNDVKNAGVYGLEIAMSSKCSLIGNTVTNSADNGISVSAVSLHCDDNLIEGNLVIAPAGNGVIMGGSANGANRTRIIGNQVVDAGNGTPVSAFTNATGIGCSDVVYANNIVRWTSVSGTPSTGFSINMPNATLIGNQIIHDAAVTTSGGTAINLAATALDCNVSGNTVVGNGKCATGIQVASAITGGLISGNKITGTTTWCVNCLATSNTVIVCNNLVTVTSGSTFQYTTAQHFGNRSTVASANFELSGASTTTAPGAGGAGALPATPLGYLTMQVNGTNRQIPYY